METLEQVVFSEVIDVNEFERTTDVISDGSFKSLLLAQSTLDSLHRHGFKKPSPVQMKAIPPGMAGLDMLVQAKSGTGKTLVFAVLAVENLKLSSKVVQKLVIAPTREIAIQIGDTIQKLAPKGARIAVLTGGTSVYEDKDKLKKGIHIAVGTTGRLCQLVNENSLSLGSLSLFVLDEADKMMSCAFEKDVNFLYSCVTPMRQVAVFSATYPPNLAISLTPFLRSPIHIRLNTNDVQLVGVNQYVSICYGTNSVDAAIIALASIQFKQAFLFCNKAEECPGVVERLVENGIESAAISALLDQSQREDVIKRFKSVKLKVLVSTDLTARGVDAHGVDLVINLETPVDVETYLHRIGRAARFGGQGASLTILSTKKSTSFFAHLVRNGGIRARIVSIDSITPTITTDRTFFESCRPFLSDERKDRNERGNVGRSDDTGAEHSIESIGDGNEDFEKQLDLDYSALLDKALHLSSSLKKNGMTYEPNKKKISEEKKLFKFVPSRAKKSTKYYMRGEMISIRDSLASHQWDEYARGRFDMTTEPFVMEECRKKNTGGENMNGKRNEMDTVIRRTTSSETRDAIKQYSRKDLIAICKSKKTQMWRRYAESKWNLSDEPFVEDQSMRCSFTDRLRLQRQREKIERDKVVADRNAARLRFISMGIVVTPLKQWEGSFEEYCVQMKHDMEKTMEGQRRGGVVNRRREKEEYRTKVQDTKRMMDHVEKTYEYNLNVALMIIKEGGIGTEPETRSDDEWVYHTQGGDVCEDKGEMEKQYVEGRQERKCEDNNNEVGEKEKVRCDIEDVQYDACHELYSSYNRNIEFSRLFNAYFMSTLR